MSEEIRTIRRYTESKNQFASLVRDLELSKMLRTQTETSDYVRKHILFDDTIEFTDDRLVFSGKKPLERGYYLPFEPDWNKLQLWHKLNAPFHISVDSSGHERNGSISGIALPLQGYDNGLVGSVSLAIGFDGKEVRVTIPDDEYINFNRTREGFTIHIKFASCSIAHTNGHPQTLYAKKDKPNENGDSSSIIALIDSDGSVKVKFEYEGEEYAVQATGLMSDLTKVGIDKWHDHTVIFDPVHKTFELLVDNRIYNDVWENPHIIPYPYHDFDWHVGSSSFDDRGLFFGGLGDFRYYHDLKFTYQHNFNLYTNRITISPIPYGQSAVIGHSYIRHGLDMGFTAGFEPPNDDGFGFLSGYIQYRSQPYDNTLSLFYAIKTFPKMDNTLTLYYDIEANDPVSNMLKLVWNIDAGTGGGGGTIENELYIRYAIRTVGGGEQPFIPTTLIAFSGDFDDNSNTTGVFNAIKAKNVNHICALGDLTYDNNADAYIDNFNILPSTLNGASASAVLGNHDHPNEDGSQSVLDQIKAYHSLPIPLYITRKIVGNVYIINMNTQDPDITDTGTGTQHDQVEDWLQEAQTMKSAGSINWIIVNMHKPFYVPPSSHHNADEESAKSTYQPLFTTYKVDFVFNGHNHNFSCSVPLGNSGTEVATLTNDVYDFKETYGQFYICAGTGGRNLYTCGTSSLYRFKNDDVYGYALLTIDQTGLVALVQFIATGGGASGIVHEFKVSKGAIYSGGGGGGSGGGGGTGVLQWESSSWSNGQTRTIQDHGEFDPFDDKLEIRAGSGRKGYFDGQGYAYLSGDQARFYIHAINYDGRIEFKVTMNSSIENCSLKLRSRHMEDDPASNRFGGYGAAISLTDVDFKREDYHNVHTGLNNPSLTTDLINGKEYPVRYTCKDNGSNVDLTVEVDYGTGSGYEIVATATDSSPISAATNKNLLLQKSYAWIRTNGASAKDMKLRDVKIYNNV